MSELEIFAVWGVRAVAAYAGLGLLFAPAFLVRGIERVDPGAKGSSWGFRLVVLPATVALWPLLLRRWLASPGAPRIESNAHRRAAERRRSP